LTGKHEGGYRVRIILDEGLMGIRYTGEGGPVSRNRRALTQVLEERGARQERGGGGEYLEEDEHFNIQVQQAVQTMWLEERPTRKSKSAPTKTNKSVRKRKNEKELI
jgi:hypothetical protein